MKKSTRIIFMVLVVVMVLSVASVAFADSASYRGRCINWFPTDNYVTKINDTNFWTDNYYCRLNGHSSGNPATSQFTRIMVGGTCVAEGPQSSGNSSPPYSDPGKLYTGRMTLEIHNRYNPGRYIYTSGAWFLTP